MGEASRRGTYEERAREAMLRQGTPDPRDCRAQVVISLLHDGNLIVRGTKDPRQTLDMLKAATYVVGNSKEAKSSEPLIVVPGRG